MFCRRMREETWTDSCLFLSARLPGKERESPQMEEEEEGEEEEEEEEETGGDAEVGLSCAEFRVNLARIFN